MKKFCETEKLTCNKCIAFRGALAITLVPLPSYMYEQ